MIEMDLGRRKLTRISPRRLARMPTLIASTYLVLPSR